MINHRYTLHKLRVSLEVIIKRTQLFLNPKGLKLVRLGGKSCYLLLKKKKLYKRLHRFTAPHETSVSRGKAGHQKK